MKLIKPSFEIIPRQKGIEGIYRQIELAGRCCYKSENKITENSSKEFVDRMINSGHGAMLEHGTIYLKLYQGNSKDIIINGTKYSQYIYDKYINNKYSKVTMCPVKGDNYYYITTNYRVLVENNWLDDLEYICEPTEYHEKRISVRFICDRGVSHEFVRHRVFSFAQESTRYCNYSKDKFGNELTFIIPNWLDLKEGIYNIDWDVIDGVSYWGWFNGERIHGNNKLDNIQFLSALSSSEESYKILLRKWDDKKVDNRYTSKFKNNPWTPQQARSILPNSLKTELIMTGFISDWEHFFKLRDSNSAHPQARELAEPLHEEFKRLNLI